MENYNNYFEKMIEDALHTRTITKVKEGQLIAVTKPGYKCIEVIDPEGKNHYLTNIKPLNYDDEEEIHGNTKNKILKEFVNKYTYSDIQKEFDKMIEENTKKVELAEANKIKLENLMQELKELENFEKVEILANNYLIEYYINLEYDYNFKIEIYYMNDNEFRYRFNYSNETLNKMQVLEKVDLVIKDIKEVEHKKELEKIEKRKEQDKKDKIYNFAEEVQGKKVLLKLKSSVVCIEDGFRFAVGKGKEGKFMRCRGIYELIKYINDKDIKEYVIINHEERYSNYTNKEFKALNWNTID